MKILSSWELVSLFNQAKRLFEVIDMRCPLSDGGQYFHFLKFKVEVRDLMLLCEHWSLSPSPFYVSTVESSKFQVLVIRYQ